MCYYYGQPVRFVDNPIVDFNPLAGKSVPNGSYVGYRTEYSDVEEIVDRKYWQPSTVAVSQVGKHPSMSKSLYDSPVVLADGRVASLNASVRHPSNDIVDTTRQLQQLKKITIEVAEADIRAQLEQTVDKNKNTVPNNLSTPPESTVGG